MLYNFQNMYLPRDAFVVRHINNLTLLQYLDGHPGLRQNMHTDLHLAKCTLSDCFAQDVLADLAFVGLQIELFFLYLTLNHLLALLGFVEGRLVGRPFHSGLTEFGTSSFSELLVVVLGASLLQPLSLPVFVAMIRCATCSAISISLHSHLYFFQSRLLTFVLPLSFG